MGNSVNTVILEGASRQRLHEEGYEQLRLSRNLVRIATAPTVTKGLTFMATQFAADNRTPLPPLYDLREEYRWRRRLPPCGFSIPRV